MFSFKKLELMNWDLWDHVMFPMDEQVIVVSGPNGSGKTTLLDALRVLLGTKTLSTSRKMSGYLRENVKVAVIKALVSNNLRRGHGRRPFTRRGIFEDTATLAVVLVNKSGAWHRQYHILPGDASLDSIREAPRGMGPEEYSQALRHAGLPRTLLKVLALEQGETHALCRRSPAQLLEYVLELQGDKAVLDAYEAARQNYAESRADHHEQEEKAREAERQLEFTARDARTYEEFRALQLEVRDIEGRRLPASRWHDLTEKREEVEAALVDARASVDRFDNEHAERIARVDGLEHDIEHLHKTIAVRKGSRMALLEAKSQVDGKARVARVRKKQLEALRERAAEAPKVDQAALERTVRAAMLAEADADRRLIDVQKKEQETESELGSLGGGRRPRLPSFVRDMKEALKAAGIEAALVAEVIDVREARWQKAVESVMGRDRFTVLVEARDSLAARQLASKVRYPAYVASLEHAVSTEPPHRSALSVVEIREPRVPRWIVSRLADCTLVESVKEGYERARDGVTITADGYRQDRRGGVYSGVESLYCGGGAGKAHEQKLRARLVELTADKKGAEDSRRAAILRRAAASRELEAAQAVAEWAAAQAEYTELAEQDAVLAEEKRQRSQAIMDVLAETEALAGQLASHEGDLKRMRHDGALGDEERRRRQVRVHELAGKEHQIRARLAELGPDVPEELRSDAAATLLETEAELKGKLVVLTSRLDNFDGCRDPGILEVLTRQQVHLEEQLGLMKKRAQELAKGEGELARARKSYIRVADATIGRYAKALRDLASRAGMEVDVRAPRLVEDDDMLREAGLEVRLGFDGKRCVRINDPKLSGGQKVLASILLLVALTYEGNSEGGGFFILDEPFAHLSVERIDDVTRFISKTRSQFLLTTPTTHNFAVFNAANLLLTLRKKKPDMPAAPPPMFLRR